MLISFGSSSHSGHLNRTVKAEVGSLVLVSSSKITLITFQLFVIQLV